MLRFKNPFSSFIEEVTIALIFFFCVSHAQASPIWYMMLYSGQPFHLPSTMQLHLNGQLAFQGKVHFYTRPLRTPWYYAWGIGYSTDRHFWEVEVMHHKLYLRDYVSLIQHLEVTHGYNYVLLNWGRKWKKAWLVLGTGGVLVHPETTVNFHNQPSGGVWGYYLTGPAVLLGSRFCLKQMKAWRFWARIQAIYAYTKFPVAQGDILFWLTVFHVQLGISRSF